MGNGVASDTNGQLDPPAGVRVEALVGSLALFVGVWLVPMLCPVLRVVRDPYGRVGRVAQ